MRLTSVHCWSDAARSNLVEPEVEAARVRFAVEKIQIVYRHKEAGRDDGTYAICDVIIGDG